MSVDIEKRVTKYVTKAITSSIKLGINPLKAQIKKNEASEGSTKKILDTAADFKKTVSDMSSRFTTMMAEKNAARRKANENKPEYSQMREEARNIRKNLPQITKGQRMSAVRQAGNQALKQNPILSTEFSGKKLVIDFSQLLMKFLPVIPMVKPKEDNVQPAPLTPKETMKEIASAAAKQALVMAEKRPKTSAEYEALIPKSSIPENAFAAQIEQRRAELQKSRDDRGVSFDRKGNMQVLPSSTKPTEETPSPALETPVPAKQEPLNSKQTLQMADDIFASMASLPSYHGTMPKANTNIFEGTDDTGISNLFKQEEAKPQASIEAPQQQMTESKQTKFEAPRKSFAEELAEKAAAKKTRTPEEYEALIPKRPEIVQDAHTTSLAQEVPSTQSFSLADKLAIALSAKEAKEMIEEDELPISKKTMDTLTNLTKPSANVSAQDIKDAIKEIRKENPDPFIDSEERLENATKVLENVLNKTSVPEPTPQKRSFEDITSQMTKGLDIKPASAPAPQVSFGTTPKTDTVAPQASTVTKKSVRFADDVPTTPKELAGNMLDELRENSLTVPTEVIGTLKNIRDNKLVSSEDIQFAVKEIRNEITLTNELHNKGLGKAVPDSVSALVNNLEKSLEKK